MSLCINKRDLQTLESKIKLIQSLETNSIDNHKNSAKKPLDSFCSSNEECDTAFCGTPENCEIIFKDPTMCQNIKVCKNTNNISQTTNFNLKSK